MVLGMPTTLTPSLGQLGGDAQGIVAADGDDRVQSQLLDIVEDLLRLVVLGVIGVGARGAQEGAAVSVPCPDYCRREDHAMRNLKAIGYGRVVCQVVGFILMSPFQPFLMPMTSNSAPASACILSSAAACTTHLSAGFKPGQSPPPVKTEILLFPY